MKKTETRGRNPLPAAEKKVRLQIYIKASEIENAGGEEAAKQILFEALKKTTHAKKNTKLC